jgi:MtN3 and saliva related transmembrane protein
MKKLFDILFGFGLFGNALLFVPQVIALWRKKSSEGSSLLTFAGFNLLQIIAIIHGIYWHDISLILGMIASLITCGAVTTLTLYYRSKNKGTHTTAK